MRAILGLTFIALVVVAIGYSFQQLVLKPAAAISEREPPSATYASGAVAPSAAPASPSIARTSDAIASPVAYVPVSPILPVPVPPKPTTGELIALLEHGTDDQAAAAIRELVAIGEPALAPLSVFQARWRKTLVALHTAEAKLSAAGEDANLAASIRKASQMSGRAATAIRAINTKQAAAAAKLLTPEPPPPPIPAAIEW